MVNDTVKGKKIGKSAGKNNRTFLNMMAVQQEGKELTEKGTHTRDVMELLNQPEGYLSIKAYVGGNPNKAKQEEKVNNVKAKEKEEDITH